jgi:hypothetical protein
MTKNNTIPTVPNEAVQRWQDAIVAAVNDASDFEIHTDDSILEDDSPSADVGVPSIDDKDEEAQPDHHTPMHGEIENDNDDQTSSSAHSSYYPESLVDDEDAVQYFKQKLLALATQLHVEFEDIGYIRESESVRAFPLTLRNPPEEAIWPDGTRAVLRMNGDLALNNRGSRGVQIADQDIILPANTTETDAPASSSLNHVYFFVQPTDGQNENAQNGSLVEPSSPVSATSDASYSSEFSGDTLINGSPMRVASESDLDSDSECYDSSESMSRYYVSTAITTTMKMNKEEINGNVLTRPSSRIFSKSMVYLLQQPLHSMWNGRMH